MQDFHSVKVLRKIKGDRNRPPLNLLIHLKLIYNFNLRNIKIERLAEILFVPFVVNHHNIGKRIVNLALKSRNLLSRAGRSLENGNHCLGIEIEFLIILTVLRMGKRSEQILHPSGPFQKYIIHNCAPFVTINTNEKT